MYDFGIIGIWNENNNRETLKRRICMYEINAAVQVVQLCIKDTLLFIDYKDC